MSYYPSSGSPYSYSAYHPPNTTAYSQTPGAYPTSAYGTYAPTAVTSYGQAWPYPYTYYPTQQQAQPVATAARSATTTTVAPTTTTTPSATTSAATTTTATPLQRTYSTSASTFTYTPTYRDPITSSATGTSRGLRKQSTFRGLFTKELRNLMYGFGDDRNPANDTVNVMEEILVEYIVDVCQTALASGKKTRLSIEDLRRALSRPADAKKLARMEDLLFMQEDIKRARAQFEESDMNQAGSFQA